MSKKKSDALLALVSKYANNSLDNPLTIEDLQSLLTSKSVPKKLYTHPVVVSILGNLLDYFRVLNLHQVNQILDEIMTVSISNNSFSLVFNNEHTSKIFSYQLKDDYLLYTKQSFVKNTCIKTVKCFDDSGNLCSSTKESFLVSQPSYNSKNYDIKEEEDYTFEL